MDFSDGGVRQVVGLRLPPANGGRGSPSEMDRGFPGQAGGLLEVARRFCLRSLHPERAMVDSFYHPGGSQGSVGQLSHPRQASRPGDPAGMKLSLSYRRRRGLAWMTLSPMLWER